MRTSTPCGFRALTEAEPVVYVCNSSAQCACLAPASRFSLPGHSRYRVFDLGIVGGGRPRMSPEQTVAGKNPWICLFCTFVYDPEEGDPASGIPPGTPFEDLPVDWMCPICGAAKADFRQLDAEE